MNTATVALMAGLA